MSIGLIRRSFFFKTTTTSKITTTATTTTTTTHQQRLSSSAGSLSTHVPPLNLLKRTPLHSLHLKPENGAKMVPFAGYEMPLSYTKSGGQVAEHSAVRNGCGLFDVSHMVQSRIRGQDATEFLLKLLPSSLSSMKPYTSTLSVLMNAEGGIIDDCLVTRWGAQDWYLVTNAGRRERDLAWINTQRQHFSADALKIDTLDGWALVALQGPQASAILQPLLDHPALLLDRTLFFGQSLHASLAGADVHIARGGYTGEDGFEIAIKPQDAARLADLLASQPGVTLAGLAARDSLRLEAGMCLYGADLDESVGVAEAGLSWLIGKDRSGFLGEHRTRSEKGALVTRRRVGLLVEKGPPARTGALITTAEGDQIGSVTSGIPSPSLANQNIAMGYVKSGHHTPGTKLQVVVRNKAREAEVVKMPFVTTNYHRAT